MKNGGVLQQYVYFTILILIKYNANSTYLFKLKRLLHHRVNPTVQLLRKKESIFQQKKANRNKTNNVPPIGTSSWCLSIKALEKFGRPTDNVPNYDPEGEDEDIENIEDENSDHQNDESDNNIAESSRKKKRRNKKEERRRRNKKEKKKKIKQENDLTR